MAVTPTIVTPPRRKDSTTSMAFGAVVAASATPYGYTISTWSSGAILIHAHGNPGAGEIFVFAAGALTGFTLLGLLSQAVLGGASSPGLVSERVIAGALHWFAVGIALGAVALIAQLPAWAAWPLGSFAVTTLYLVCASLQLAVVSNRGR